MIAVPENLPFPHAMTQPPFSVRLADQGLIRATGADAATFLHNLLTNDINHLAAGQARHAGLCTAKGRLLASFLIWREGDDYLLQLSADLLPGILKKMSMFILRSKVRLEDVSAERALIGTVGAAGGPESPLACVPVAGGNALRLDAARCIFAVPTDQADAVLATLPPAGRLEDWHLAEIRAGMPRIVAATQEAFVPQMVNYEVPAVGGVSFQKGCYPGQEIVARTHYLGKVKRRMVRVALDAAVAPGTDVFTPETGEQHCGAIVLCAPVPPAEGGGYEALLVVQNPDAHAATIHVGAPDGPLARMLDLPYTVE